MLKQAVMGYHVLLTLLKRSSPVLCALSEQSSLLLTFYLSQVCLLALSIFINTLVCCFAVIELSLIRYPVYFQCPLARTSDDHAGIISTAALDGDMTRQELLVVLVHRTRQVPQEYIVHTAGLFDVDILNRT